MLTNLRIGTSGWSYPSGRGTWNGIFYPPAPKARATKGSARPKFDELAYYAEHFDTVEINTTFYGQPKATVAKSWANRTPAGFEFSLKLYRLLTHGEGPSGPRLDSDLIDVTTSPVAFRVPDYALGWRLDLASEEKTLAESLTTNGVILFTSFKAAASGETE